MKRVMFCSMLACALLDTPLQAKSFWQRSSRCCCQCHRPDDSSVTYTPCSSDTIDEDFMLSLPMQQSEQSDEIDEQVTPDQMPGTHDSEMISLVNKMREDNEIAPEESDENEDLSDLNLDVPLEPLPNLPEIKSNAVEQDDSQHIVPKIPDITPVDLPLSDDKSNNNASDHLVPKAPELKPVVLPPLEPVSAKAQADAETQKRIAEFKSIRQKYSDEQMQRILQAMDDLDAYDEALSQNQETQKKWQELYGSLPEQDKALLQQPPESMAEPAALDQAAAAKLDEQISMLEAELQAAEQFGVKRPQQPVEETSELLGNEQPSQQTESISPGDKSVIINK